MKRLRSCRGSMSRPKRRRPRPLRPKRLKVARGLRALKRRHQWISRRKRGLRRSR